MLVIDRPLTEAELAEQRDANAQMRALGYGGGDDEEEEAEGPDAGESSAGSRAESRLAAYTNSIDY